MSDASSAVTSRNPDIFQAHKNEQREQPLETSVEKIGRKAIELQDGLLLWAGLGDARLKEREIKPITETSLKELIEESAKNHDPMSESDKLALFPDGLTLRVMDERFHQILRQYRFRDINRWHGKGDDFPNGHKIIRYRKIERVAMLQYIVSKLDKLSARRTNYLFDMLCKERFGNPLIYIPLIYLQTQLSSKLSNKYKWIKSLPDYPNCGELNQVTRDFNEILNPDEECCHLRDYVHDLLSEMIFNEFSCGAKYLDQDDLQWLEAKGYITLAADRYRETGRGWVVRITETGDPLVRVDKDSLLPLGEISPEDRAYLEEEEEEVRQARERGEEKELNIWTGYRMSGITDKTARLILDQICA
ncbi:MAG: hypothetical protein WAM28_03680 [Chlamydiales bacterium]